MFPYISGAHDSWTGYFTSRANAKSYFRRASSQFSASSQIFSKNLSTEVLNQTYAMLDVLGIVQHHDAITGTAK
jgi:hypothetical protein